MLQAYANQGLCNANASKKGFTVWGKSCWRLKFDSGQQQPGIFPEIKRDSFFLRFSGHNRTPIAVLEMKERMGYFELK